jgi:glucose-6-phosphate 1-dehydrogenase
MSWKLLTPILEHWEANPPNDFPNYSSGTWGPEKAEEMLKRQDRKWRLI